MAAREARQASAKTNAVAQLFAIIFLLYQPVTNKIFQAFECRQIGPGASVLTVDNSIQCTEDGSLTMAYTALYVCCLVLVFLWPVGVPTALFFGLRAQVSKHDQSELTMFSSVVDPYTAHCWYWELVEFARKLLLSGLLVLFRQGSVAQTVFATFIAFFFFAAHIRAQPFKKMALNVVKAYSEAIIFGVIVLCTVQQTVEVSSRDFNAEEEPFTIDLYGNIQTGLCIVLVPVTLFYVGKELRDTVASDEHESREMPQQEKSDGQGVAGDLYDNPIQETDTE
jgi:hypothetical protein